ncbi:MAG: hypothetical protein ACREJ2_19135 [Planctomycetota bacterium]
MALVVSAGFDFLTSNALPPVCIFTGGRENVKRVPLPMPQGVPNGLPPVQVMAVPGAAGRFWLRERLTGPAVSLWLALATVGATLIPVPWLGGCTVFQAMGRAAERPFLTLLLVVLFAAPWAALLLGKLAKKRNLQIDWVSSQAQFVFTFPDRLMGAYLAWREAVAKFEGDDSPLQVDPTRDPEEDWVDGREGRWDAAAGTESGSSGGGVVQ